MSEGDKEGSSGVTLSPEDQARLRRRQADRQAAFAARQRLSRRRLLAGAAAIGAAIAIKPLVSAVETAVEELPDRKALKMFLETKEQERLTRIEVIEEGGVNARFSPVAEEGINNWAKTLKKGEVIPEGIFFPVKDAYDPTDGDVHRQKQTLNWIAFSDSDKQGNMRMLFLYPKTNASTVNVVTYTEPPQPAKP